MKLRNIKFGLLFVLILASFLIPAQIPVVAASQSDIQLAQQSGQNYISSADGLKMCPEWKDATLKKGITCYDLNDNIIAFMFSITKGNIALGYITVGSSSYSFDVLEAVAEAPVPSVSSDEANVIITKDGNNANNLISKLVYLGYRRYYSVYESKNGKIAIEDNTKSLVDISKLSTDLASPEKYKQNRADITSNMSPLSSPSVYLNVPIENGGNAPSGYNSNDCGPTTGAMIVEWYKTHGYPNFQGWSSDEVSLYVDMYCNTWIPGLC